jgi:methylated-DNA-[protein]-cysteine S-methyltransferase
MANDPGPMLQYRLFDTSLGQCGVAWSERGLARLQLPEATPAATEARLQARAAAVPARKLPAAVADTIAQLRAYFSGSRVDFAAVALDLGAVGDFYRSIYAAARCVGWGQTASYGELAKRAGFPGAARGVGQAMRRNPVPIIIPCHRILASGKKVGGFSAFGGRATKERLLALEGVGPAGSHPVLPNLMAPLR